MNQILDQLGLDQTFFIELVLISLILSILSSVYFKPFLRLFQLRSEMLTKNEEKEALYIQKAQEKLEAYQKLMADEKLRLKENEELAMERVLKHKEEIIALAQQEALKISEQTQEAFEIESKNVYQEVSSQLEPMAKDLASELLERKL